jgi:hypothetical protein
LTGIEWFVVDYDIPAEPASRHMQFYRRLWKLLGAANIEIRKRSTQSVWILDDMGIAKQIHDLASVYGVSHWYRAERIT